MSFKNDTYGAFCGHRKNVDGLLSERKWTFTGNKSPLLPKRPFSGRACPICKLDVSDVKKTPQAECLQG